MYSFDPVSGLMIPFAATWKRAVFSAVPIGIPHQYASSNYGNHVSYTDQVGEIIGAPRTYSNAAPNPVPLGVNYCGAAGLWTGRLSRLTVPLPVDGAGNPLCCTRGTDTFCRLCTHQTAALTHTVRLIGGTGDFAGLNGVWVMTGNAPCQWLLNNGTVIMQLTVSTLGVIMAAGFDGSSVHCDYVRPLPWDCHAALGTMPLTFSDGAGTPPRCFLT